MSKKKLKIKKRQDVITGTTKGVISKLTVVYDPTDGRLEICELDPDTLVLTRSYERASGKEKILTSIKANSPRVSFDVWQQLASSFSYLIAIDTNTIEIGERRVSVTFAYHCVARANDKKQVPFWPLGGYVSVNINPLINPERFGWHLILRHNVCRASFVDQSLGVIVDSEYSHISSINSRLSPYYQDNVLPEFATLIYASDAAADSLPNQMIRYCDAAANAVLSRLIVNSETLNGLTSDDDNCEGYAWFAGRKT